MDLGWNLRAHPASMRFPSLNALSQDSIQRISASVIVNWTSTPSDLVYIIYFAVRMPSSANSQADSRECASLATLKEWGQRCPCGRECTLAVTSGSNATPCTYSRLLRDQNPQNRALCVDSKSCNITYHQGTGSHGFARDTDRKNIRLKTADEG